MKKFNESDYIYKAKIGDKLYLQGNSQDGWDTTSDPDEAAIFESKTEPTQIINQMKKDGKISKNDKITVLSESISDFKGHLLLGTAVLGIGTLTAIDHNKAKLTADKLGIELAETEYGPHKAAGLVGPIYEYKYGMKGPMNIDSLCEYLKNHTDYDEITYEDEGDNYVINYTDNYAIHQTAANATVTKHRTSKGNLNLPKEYFDVSFVLDESKIALFDCLLEEGKLSKSIKLNEGLFGTNHPTLREFFNIENFHCSSKTQFCIFDGDKEEPDATLVVYGYDIIEGEEEVQPYLDKRIEYINFDTLDKRVDICLITQMKESTIKEGYDNLFENALNESNAVIAPWKRERAERLIEEANKIDPSYSFVEYDIGPKKEIKYKIFKNDNEYVGTFDVFTDDPYNSPYRYFFHHVNVGGLEFQGMTIDEFNKDFNEFIELDERVGHKALNEARVFSHSSGFGLSGHYNDYETPRKEPLYIATETNEDDGELYFDERGCTTEFKTDAKRFTSKEDALEFAKKNAIFGEPGTKLIEKRKENTMKKEKPFSTILNEGLPTVAERKAKMEAVKNMSFDELIEKYMPKAFINDKGELELSNQLVGTICGEWLIFSDKSIKYKNVKKGWNGPDDFVIREWEWHKGDKLTGSYSDLAMISNWTKIPIYVLKLIFEKFNAEMRISESLSDSVIQKEENTMKKLFENSDNLFDYVLNESSLKENISSLEWLLDKAYVSEYRMVGKNSAEVRVRHTPELLTSDSMAARFEEDIPDGYRLEVDYLGEDPILGRNFDIYEVQLIKD